MEELPSSSVRGFEDCGDPEDIFVMDVDCDSLANCGLDANGQKLHDDGDDCGKLSSYDEACVVFENSHVTVNTIESELPCENKDEESPLSGSKWTAKDESMALWVKWRGKWQAGIKCERADWPLDTVKARPTHDRKNYIVVFFPHNRNYSWVDTFLVRPIDDLPDPIVHKSYELGFQLVQDLSIARRFIMQKLAVGVLNIFDRLHFQVLVATARDIAVWKEFAMEAPRCKGYSDLGGMLVKFQKMVLEQYIDGNWLKDSFNSWANQCQNALSAEFVELLLEELVNSLLWKEISAVQDVQGLPANGAEWKTWKNEVLKLFSTSVNPIATVAELEQPSKTIIDQQGINSLFSMSPQVSRKRPKLEVRRAEAHTFQAENKGQKDDAIAEIDSEYFARQSTEVVEHGSLADQKGESSSDNLNLNGVSETNPMSSGTTKSRKCKAYIEAKGRQCVRWANEGDEYCCVHLAARFTGNTVKAVVQPVIDSPLCGGTTTQGTKCKHRALPGSSFCKKHRPRDGSGTKVSSHFKRKHRDLVKIPGNPYSMDLILGEESEQPLQVEPLSMRVVHNGRSSLVQMPQHFKEDYNCSDKQSCVGLGFHNGIPSCLESPTRHSLYCDKHIPSWLKRARNGKSRIISKEVFMELLRGCSSRDQKVNLHQACELFYKLFKSVLSMRNQVPREIQFQWALSEASKDSEVANFLMRLVSCEKARIRRIWGFGYDEDNQISSYAAEPTRILVTQQEEEGSFKCKLCSEDFADDQELGTHWIDSHNKEAQWYFRGYACSICLDSFTNRKVLEAHVQDRHHAQFSDHCMLYRCIPCGGHFGNSDKLWSHVLSSHTDDFRQSINSVEQHTLLDGGDSSIQLGPPKANNSENQGTVRKYICKFCGLKFDLLPDLGRHHQAAHMRQTLSSSRHPKGVRFYSYRLKSGRLTRPKFKKGLGGVPYTLKNKVAAGLKKGLQASKSIGSTGVNPPQHVTTLAKGLGRLAESECLSIAKKLFCEAQKTRARPNNMEILNIARSSCCKVSLQASLEEKYGILPKRLYLRAAKLCGEHNTKVNWHQEDFSCLKGCKSRKDENALSSLTPLSDDHVASTFVPPADDEMGKWEKDECHYIINSNDLRHNHFQTTIILCDDISFGEEAVPITCIIDKNMLDSLHVPTYGFNGQFTYLPWESFRYVVTPVLDPTLDLNNTQNLRLGCSQSECSPETCDQVYLFNTDYEDAKDIYGKPMTRRFPYDENSKIILEEGYMVYECNHLCKCSKSCPNRILQNGVQAKIEVFKTLKKGWAVRAGESIPCGTFICELIGEIIDEQEANRRRKRCGKKYCSYIYNVGSCMNKISQLMDEKVSCVIDTSKIGNVSRYLNHSCSPNLVTRPVLVESMDYELARIGLYATRDIAVGEELTFDYGNESLHEEGSSCFCGSSSCRGRLF